MFFKRTNAVYISFLSLFVLFFSFSSNAEEGVYGIMFQEGRRNYVLKNYVEAVKNFRKVYKIKEDDSVNKLFLYRSLVKQGDLEYKKKDLSEAEKYYSEALNLYDDPNPEILNKINTIVEVRSFLSHEEIRYSKNLTVIVMLFLLPFTILVILISITFYHSRKSHKNTMDVKKYFRIDFDPNIKLLEYKKQDGNDQVKAGEVEKRYRNSVKSELFRFISKLIDAKTGRKNHSQGVAELAYRIAKIMKDPSLLPERVKMVALIHDIGFLSIDNNYSKDFMGITGGSSNKDDFLNNWQENASDIKMHPERGTELLEYMNLPDIYLDGIMYHHENFDGTGFPDGLSGEHIPKIARIIAVADHYLFYFATCGRNKEKSLEKIKELSGSVLDPSMTDLLEVIVN